MVMFGHMNRKNCYDLILVEANIQGGVHVDEVAEHLGGPVKLGRQKALDVRNKTRRASTYQVGDMVWRQVMQPALPGTRHALDDRYTGPFIITELRDASAVLDDALSPLRSKPVVHLDQLKHCIPGMQALGEDWDGLTPGFISVTPSL